MSIKLSSSFKDNLQVREDLLTLEKNLLASGKYNDKFIQEELSQYAAITDMKIDNLQQFKGEQLVKVIDKRTKFII